MLINYYCHLSHKERIVIYEYLYQGCSIQKIAPVVGYHKTTIYRELHRNSGKIGHKPGKAEHTYQLRKNIGQLNSTKIQN